MSEVLLRFEREDREGFVAVGSYLMDAAKRLGIDLTVISDEDGSVVEQPVIVKKGAEVLSSLTEEEAKLFDAGKATERLASQTRFEKPGEVIIMTTEKKEPEKEDDGADYAKQFTELPLEKKMSRLLELEMIALGETFSFVLNSPYLVADKIMDVMSEFGLKKEAAEKNAARPTEHKAKPEPKARAKKGAKTTQKRDPAPKPAKDTE